MSATSASRTSPSAADGSSSPGPETIPRLAVHTADEIPGTAIVATPNGPPADEVARVDRATAGAADRAVAETGPSPREQRRRQRLKVGREQILDAAEELFGRNGYRGTSLQQVAKRCEFSIGALYLFIDSKEELLRGVLERRSVELAAQMRACAERDGSAHDLLVELTRVRISFHRRYPDFGRLWTRITAAGVEVVPNFDAILADDRVRAVEVETYLVRRGQADGSVRAGDPRGLARMFSSMVSAYHALDPAVADGADFLDDDDFVDTVSRAFAAA